MTGPKAQSLTLRAVLALALMVGFYILALAVAGLLLFLVYVQIAGRYFNPYLLLICIAGAAVIIWSIIPRSEKFVPPGPRLEPRDHPGLFAELESIARSSGQKMPSEVYILPDVNAAVTQRGGFMGLGGRRIMLIGLPLFGILTVPQLRSIISHEFGHYYSGDTRLGPWVYRTRSAIIRTLWGLRGHSIIQIPFRGYGILFLRTTQSISRRQEYCADALAARLAGPRNLISALRLIHGTAPAWQVFWREECAPVLSAGLAAPLVEGFGRFIRAKPIMEKINRIVEHEISEAKTRPYDSHPSLKDRIAALQTLPEVAPETGGPPALSLIGDVDPIEAGLLRNIAERNHLPGIKPVAWEDLIDRFYLPAWANLVSRHKPALAGITPDSLPEIARNPDGLESRLVESENITLDARKEVCRRVIGAALILALMQKGWQVRTSPGEEISIFREEKTLLPFRVYPNLVSGAITGGQWLHVCRTTGISGMDLSRITEGAAPPPAGAQPHRQ